MLAVGVGARAGTSAGDLATAVQGALAEAGVEVLDGTVLATLDRRAAEPGVQELARERGWRLVAFTAAELAAQPVPGAPSDVVAAAVGTPSVAEAAALLAAGAGGELVLPKRVYGGVTVAIARG
ncbi:cobalt-precorrin 5A hydrolase [Actinoplanes octamycinicus]|uniref:Cobalt-precorrin 5A hydrolase n=1 Tax=Actinoplanes octamycinicus TaxID=135948 RepID=A0A7W7MBX3_9ACTN|nr:cobalamin biosynthesis protein [Actinoplanes octamycinicus]MBB4744542.1 cobalt-precorrin 5A hydrolase [Actinoplanes octamycinicus]